MSLSRGEKRAAVFLTVGIVLALALLWTLLGLLPRFEAPSGIVDVQLSIEAPGWSLAYAANTTNRTVLSFLLEASAIRGFEVEWTYWDTLQAAKVDAINGIRDGQGGLYWQYWVNDVYGNVGADRYVLQNGNHVIWRFTTFPPEA